MSMINHNNINKINGEFHNHHNSNETSIMANIWRTGSAILLEEAISRSNEYWRVGADCLFAPELIDIVTIRPDPDPDQKK